MTKSDRLDLRRNATSVLQALGGVEQIHGNAGLDPKLIHLVRLRASQINGCAYCVEMHTREAREDGESTDRLDRVVVWRDTEAFTAPERAALAWTEALTTLEDTYRLDALHAELKRHFTDTEIGTLTTLAAMINVWNRIQIAGHGGRSLAAA